MDNYMDIMNKKFEVMDLIEDLSLFEEIKELNESINNNPEIKNLIEEFNKVKLEFEEVSKYGKYHPDYEDTRTKLTNVKTTLYNVPLVKEYKEKELELSMLIQNINRAFKILKPAHKCEKTSR